MSLHFCFYSFIQIGISSSVTELRPHFNWNDGWSNLSVMYNCFFFFLTVSFCFLILGSSKSEYDQSCGRSALMESTEFMIKLFTFFLPLNFSSSMAVSIFASSFCRILLWSKWLGLFEISWKTYQTSRALLSCVLNIQAPRHCLAVQIRMPWQFWINFLGLESQ